MRRLVALAALLSLSACSPRNDGGVAAQEPASAPPPAPVASATPPAPPAPTPPDPLFAGDLDALGTEPFWSVEVRAASLTLKRPDHPDVAVTHGGPEAQGNAAVFSGGQGAGALRLTLRKATCSDGMSDRTYPLTAELEAGGETLKGCAAPPA